MGDMKNSEEFKHKLLHRLKIARGHLDKVIRMIQSDTYCIDVLNQSKAVENALKQVDGLLLENHLKTCVIDLVKQDKAKSGIEEIMRIFRKT